MLQKDFQKVVDFLISSGDLDKESLESDWEPLAKNEKQKSDLLALKEKLLSKQAADPANMTKAQKKRAKDKAKQMAKKNEG